MKYFMATIVFLLLIGCATTRKGPTVYVKSMGYKVDQGATFSFQNFQLPSEPTEAFFNRKKVIDACIEVGKMNNISTESIDTPNTFKDRDAKYLIVIEVGSKGQVFQTIHPGYNSGSTTTCNVNSYGSVYGTSASCGDNGNWTMPAYVSSHNEYSKVARMNIFSRDDLFNKDKSKNPEAKPRRIVTAGLWSLNDDISDLTANALCRAIYSNFPNDTDQQYEVQDPSLKAPPPKEKGLIDKLKDSMGLAGN